MPLSEEAKQKKREYQREYQKRTHDASQNKYRKNNTKLVSIRMYMPKDGDILEWIDQQPMKQQYLRDLIRADMERKKQ